MRDEAYKAFSRYRPGIRVSVSLVDLAAWIDGQEMSEWDRDWLIKDIQGQLDRGKHLPVTEAGGLGKESE